ncbi:MAG TPA: hypothetical protein VFJ14_16910 [Nocardioidaceae bacterium]|nr:hypothetical protein [Nocardioidaceae bacterium]
MGEIEKATTEELEAALEARRELGRSFEQELVESFVDKIDARITARVDAQVAERTRGSKHLDKKAGQRQMILGFVSLGTGIPITAIAGGTGELAGIIAAWVGIVGVNVAHAVSSWRPD